MMVDLISVKKSFSTVVEDVPPWMFSHFMMWLDLKVAEYKVYGYMLMDEEAKKTGHSSRKRNDFIRFVSESGPHQSNRAEGSRHLSDIISPDDSTNNSTPKSQTSSAQQSATTPSFSSPLKRTSNMTQETRLGQKPLSQSETKTSDQSETNRNNITTLDFSDMKIDPQTDTQVSQSEWSESIVPSEPCAYKSDQHRTGSFLQHETKFEQDIKNVSVQQDVFSETVQSQNDSDIPFKQPRVEVPGAVALDHQSNQNIKSNPETNTAQKNLGHGSSYNVSTPILHSPSKDNGIFSASHSLGSNSGQQSRSGYTSASGETSFMVCDARTMHPIWHSQANETMSTTGPFGDRQPYKSEQFSQGSSSIGYPTQKSQVQSGNSAVNSPVGDISSLQTLIKIEIDSDESQEPCMMNVSQSADKTGSQSFYHPGTEQAGQPFSSGTSQTQNQTLYLEPISGTTSDEGINQLIGEGTPLSSLMPKQIVVNQHFTDNSRRPESKELQDSSGNFLLNVLLRLDAVVKSQQEQLALLRNVVSNSQGPDTESTDEIISTPFGSVEELERFCQKLEENPELSKKMICYMSSLGGCNTRDSVRRMMRRLGTKTLWSQYSLKGRKGKRAFQELLICRILIRAGLRNNGKAKEIEIEEAISETLKYAPNQCGAVKCKVPEQKKELIFRAEEENNSDC